MATLVPQDLGDDGSVVVLGIVMSVSRENVTQAMTSYVKIRNTGRRGLRTESYAQRRCCLRQALQIIPPSFLSRGDLQQEDTCMVLHLLTNYGQEKGRAAESRHPVVIPSKDIARIINLLY